MCEHKHIYIGEFRILKNPIWEDGSQHIFMQPLHICGDCMTVLPMKSQNIKTLSTEVPMSNDCKNYSKKKEEKIKWEGTVAWDKAEDGNIFPSALSPQQFQCAPISGQLIGKYTKVTIEEI